MAKGLNRTDFGALGRKARKKLDNDNDVKVIIQGANSQTGIGKTTLAIQLCRYIDNDWNAQEKAFVNVREYIKAHLDGQKGSALLLDEIEAGADSRRAMSQDNVDLSQAWATLRARNIATIATLPSISMLDSRMLELSDYWILVKSRGVAQPYEINVNDFAPHRAPQRKPLPGQEHIRFQDLPDDDRDKTHLDEIKDEMLREETVGYVKESECQNRVEKAKKEAETTMRNDLIVDMYYEFDDISYQNIADLPCISTSKQNVNRIIRND